MKQILGKVGKKYFIEQPFICDYGYNIEIGENFYSNHNLTILDCAKVFFGDNVFLGPNCSFYTAEHPLYAEKRNKGFEYAKLIKIGNNVWIGGRGYYQEWGKEPIEMKPGDVINIPAIEYYQKLVKRLALFQ